MGSEWRPRLVLIGLFAVFFVPVITAVVVSAKFSSWIPFGTVNRGELIAPPLAIDGLTGGHSLSMQWVVLHATTADCARECVAALSAMRQARLALGKDADRLVRVLLLSDTSAIAQGSVASIGRRFPGLIVRRVGREIISQLPSPGHGTIYLADPEHRLILRYDRADPAGDIFKDLKRLLKVSSQR